MGVTIFYARLIISLNLVADLLYRVLDPRVRYDDGASLAPSVRSRD